MTDVEKYHTVLQELGALLAQKNDRIDMLQWQVTHLEGRLREAEAAAKKPHIETREV